MLERGTSAQSLRDFSSLSSKSKANRHHQGTNATKLLWIITIGRQAFFHTDQMASRVNKDASDMPGDVYCRRANFISDIRTIDAIFLSQLTCLSSENRA